jgi:ribosomal protein S12 methylthiotransferase accessory factor
MHATMHGPEPAAAVLARLRPVLGAAGITRVGVLTGLDTLGVPVAAATRPNSWSIAVHQGKGLTTDAAKLAAVMEGIECHCAERLDRPLRLATPADLAADPAGLGAVLDIAGLPRARGGADPAGRRLLWVEGEDLLRGGAIWVPREVVAADWVLPPVPGEACFQASTNGLGAGLTLEAATLHGLYEVIERDAVALWRARPAAARAATAIDPASVDGPASRALIDRMVARGAFVALWDATSDVGVPVFVVLLGDAAGRLQPELGFGCHAVPDAALVRALTEAAQSRLTVISGARDDFSDADYDGAERMAFARTVARTAGARTGVARTGVARSFADVAGMAPGLPAALAALAAGGVRQVARVDLSRPELAPARVARVVVPGLEGGHTGPEGEYLPGPRAAAVAA